MQGQQKYRREGCREQGKYRKETDGRGAGEKGKTERRGRRDGGREQGKYGKERQNGWG